MTSIDLYARVEIRLTVAGCTHLRRANRADLIRYDERGPLAVARLAELMALFGGFFKRPSAAPFDPRLRVLDP